MFERLKNPDYWKRMVLASAVSWRQRQSAKPIGSLYGWDVWAMDGKAFLFREGRKHCLRSDWFDFCNAIRKWVGYREGA